VLSSLEQTEVLGAHRRHASNRSSTTTPWTSGSSTPSTDSSSPSTRATRTTRGDLRTRSRSTRHQQLGRPAQRGQLINDMAKDERAVYIPGTEQDACRPASRSLSVGDEVIGIMTMDRPGRRTFRERELEPARLRQPPPSPSATRSSTTSWRRRRASSRAARHAHGS
jgi:hypothetical protein